jgi:type I restriction enzyme S subunit
MNPAQLLAHFDRISEAPDAIPRLRRFILDLAVRGKLVEQDPSDEPASELLRQIQAEKAPLVAAGHGRRHDALPTIESDEVPFGVPPMWALVRLGDALRLVNGRAFKPTEWSKSGLPIIRIQNLNDRQAPFNFCDTSIPDRFHVKTGDFLISWSGTPGTSFGAHIWDRGPAILNQHIFRAELIGDAFLPAFLKLAINSRLLELIDQAHGGVGLQHVTKPTLERLPLTLPPLAEQHRIVAKVDELMALCDRLGAAQAERENRRDRLVAASLDRLNQPGDAGDTPVFGDHARFHLSHLPRLTTRP